MFSSEHNGSDRADESRTFADVLGQKLGNLRMLAFSIDFLQFLGSQNFAQDLHFSTLQFLSNSCLARDFREGTQFGIN